jgi:hypothetical protein
MAPSKVVFDQRSSFSSVALAAPSLALKLDEICVAPSLRKS